MLKVDISLVEFPAFNNKSNFEFRECRKLYSLLYVNTPDQKSLVFQFFIQTSYYCSKQSINKKRPTLLNKNFIAILTQFSGHKNAIQRYFFVLSLPCILLTHRSMDTILDP